MVLWVVVGSRREEGEQKGDLCLLTCLGKALLLLDFVVLATSLCAHPAHGLARASPATQSLAGVATFSARLFLPQCIPLYPQAKRLQPGHATQSHLPPVPMLGPVGTHGTRLTHLT